MLGKVLDRHAGSDCVVTGCVVLLSCIAAVSLNVHT